MTSSLLADLKAKLPEFAAIRRDIHQHPETAFEEVRTAAIVAEALAGYGLDVVTGIAETGVVGILRAGTGDRAIGLRADMDALDMDELNGFAHRSVNAGKMHGCGHDGHTATLLAAAAYLSANPHFDGIVYFIFQPAEEGRAGAKRMIEEGLFERFPMEAVFGLHNIPGIPLGAFAAKPGPMMAGCDSFEIVIHGAGGHGAMPHLASDPVTATGAMIQALQTILTRNMDPLQSAVLSITQVHGGSAFNVIPDEVKLGGTVRYFDKAVQALIRQRMEEIATLVARAHGCEATLRYDALFPATINSTAEAELCVRVLRDLVGEDRVDADPQPLMASEDFAFMLEAKPGCYIWAGNGAGDGGCSIHNPRYDFNDDLIPFGAAYWVRLVETALPSGAAEPAELLQRDLVA
jgi:hippurate hydrolase